MNAYNITWSRFEELNNDTTAAFERMCRLLFKKCFFDETTIFHANPNNPGIEVEPTFSKRIGKRISFQSKYFSKTDYNQIKDSIEKVAKYYGGQLDILYLYCNKDFTTTSKSYEKIKDYLNAYSIELKAVTNQEILNSVLDYPVITTGFFGVKLFEQKWFENTVHTATSELGVRYNPEFNVETKINMYIDLFSRNQSAVEYINHKKESAKKCISEYYNYEYEDYLDKLYGIINNIPNVDVGSILDCLTWSSIIDESMSKELIEIRKTIDSKQHDLENLDQKEYIETQNNIRDLSELFNLAAILDFEKLESDLLKSNMLIVEGEAGIGKSQLFADTAECCVKNGGYALLYLGGSFLSSDSAMDQMISIYEIGYSVNDFLASLECLAEINNKHIVIFIDAINESDNLNVWERDIVQIQNKLMNYPHLKCAISMRTGYEQLLIGEATKQRINDRRILRIHHYGFRHESIEATKQFLHYYNIPFFPSYFLRGEMTNPLFLTLFCKTYSDYPNMLKDRDFDIFSVFEAVIKEVDVKTQRILNLDGTENILPDFLREITIHMLNNRNRAISKTDLLNLEYWSTYGFSDRKVKYIAELIKAGILSKFARERTEFYAFGYDLMCDFEFAKTIMNLNQEKEALLMYLQKDLLKIENGELGSLNFINTFVIVCCLYADKYHEEAINIISQLSDEYSKEIIMDGYLKAYSWRSISSINSEDFIKLIYDNGISAVDIFPMLIENSIKPLHPLNADFLHELLFAMPLNTRDHLWTEYINGLYDEEERIFQLIDLFESGNTLENLNSENSELILTLFGWLLTTSNRCLRDRVSQAMINIMKESFSCILNVLKKFKGVNDPYVYERLFGIILGAVLKRTDISRELYKELSEYIYGEIFNKDVVYSDILLRDYARLILERWKWEFPDDAVVIDYRKVSPPYGSPDIPTVEKQEYRESSDNQFGFRMIADSMYPDIGNGLYGDFGRYVFQSAVKEFDSVDMENVYHYSMQYIRDVLGYTDDLFSDYDYSCSRYNRYDTKKLERIGKKYQWIVMHKVLAHLADNYMIERFDEEPRNYQGAWDIHVRDFEPTLNEKMLLVKDLPEFELCEECINHSDVFIDENANETEARSWIADKGIYLKALETQFVVQDKIGTGWFVLYQYRNMKNERALCQRMSLRYKSGKQDIWLMSNAYFVNEADYSLIVDKIENKNFMGRWFPECENETRMFNRELPWAPGCEELRTTSWKEYMNKEETGIKCKGIVPIFEKYDELMQQLYKADSDVDSEINEILSFEKKEYEQTEYSYEKIASVLPATISMLWEEESDASKHETISYNIPCVEILDNLRLSQQEADGYFYNEQGELIAFDGELSGCFRGMLIREKELNDFLLSKKYRMFWTCLGEKRFYLGGDPSNQIWSEWSAFKYCENNQVKGILTIQN